MQWSDWSSDVCSSDLCQLFVNGYQFGKYGIFGIFPLQFHTSLTISTVNNLGPQTAFPVPEGVLNYNGKNYIGLTLWALDEQGAKLGGFELVPQMPVLSGYQKPVPVPQPGWTLRAGAY